MRDNIRYPTFREGHQGMRAALGVNRASAGAVDAERDRELSRPASRRYKPYQVTAQRINDVWLVHVPEIDLWARAKTLDDVEDLARGMVGIAQRVEPGCVDLEIRVSAPRR